ncbi:uncharacterized protein PpBr36_10454 [Pyricularia pennisetigena]|uniref:uncharacterized protein n=1 Tax=Pyricularia pennisetigena TaxID=1578925 RepID=UPI00114E0085|nr:uncharacterized protein PpBr36_10454 [Pyricularia pennisetigena]TLS21241.1 hypothetical protein PpBr36_10454 [Pyricularia pennisetigena]
MDRATNPKQKEWFRTLLNKPEEDLFELDDSYFTESNSGDGAEEQGQDTSRNSDKQPNNNTSNVSNQENRYGEKMENSKRKYSGRHILGIYGVAWTRAEKKPTTYVLVKWNINGKKIKSWETRSYIRRLWKKSDKADQAIHNAAVKAENRYRMAQGWGRLSSRSPSVSLIHDTVEQKRAESLNPVSSAQEHVKTSSQTADPTPADASIAQLLAMLPASRGTVAKHTASMHPVASAPSRGMTSPSQAPNRLANFNPTELIPIFNQFLNFMQSAQASTPAALPI